jgi:NTP pyrophosphatase (non-canonical NTP hydrolase)
MKFDNLIDNVVGWASDKDILKKENATKQMLKVIEEVGETAGALAKNKEDDIKDGIGDSFVTLIILAKQMGFEPSECLEAAWNEIKDRTGKTVNGVFIKE